MQLEHRIFTRLNITSNEFVPMIDIRDPQSGSDIGDIKIEDLSASGIGLITSFQDARDIHLGKTVLIKIHGLNDEVIECCGQVVRRRRNFDSFNIGIEFFELPLYQRDILNKGVQKILVEKQLKAVKKPSIVPTEASRADSPSLVKKTATTAVVAGSFGFVFGLLNNVAPDFGAVIQFIAGLI